MRRPERGIAVPHLADDEGFHTTPIRDHTAEGEDQDGPQPVAVPRPGQRAHAGFLAQDLKAAMDAAGVDFGAWGLEDRDDAASRQWTRPDQLVAVLWAALRETRAEVAALRRAA